jgi:hypothetical protein
MSSPEENSDPVISPFNDVRENVRRFNEDEAVWRCFKKKRALRKRLLRLLGPPASKPLLTKAARRSRLAGSRARSQTRPGDRNLDPP